VNDDRVLESDLRADGALVDDDELVEVCFGSRWQATNDDGVLLLARIGGRVQELGS
tara:strand:- start:114 stop:281 length:168 start_codon:yes stop_codon:yes gene_type:complete